MTDNISASGAPTGATPAGWYADPWAPGVVRYWDGAAWTPHVQAPPTRTPEVNTQTVWIWLIALLPLVSVLTILIVPWRSILEETIAASMDPRRAPFASLGIYTSPWYLLAMFVGIVLSGLIVWFAYLDHRELRARGIDRPFPWPWAFLNSVYAVGRAIVSIRRTGRGAGVLWAVGLANLAGLIAGGIIVGISIEVTLDSITDIVRSANSYR
ncbi:DUF2510 domain-containing protein [Microbacterium sp. cx-59]|uniref:DUF2510 domain-containing protein n=1 Tax=Microbacterium sp. cx-59 TaxID=2891207 RepID=UPI001E574AB9|nr:DUF2510 domain-containing protein [Microbacterium sp. cx-59]MCC4908129.1 DUF2510 domain-containing protein [Microbacterium sp. cx-59]